MRLGKQQEPTSGDRVAEGQVGVISHPVDTTKKEVANDSVPILVQDEQV